MNDQPEAPEELGYILASNLETIFSQYIADKEALEKAIGFTRDSAILAAARRQLAYLRKYHSLDVRP
jgi:hypothetical protein